MVRYIYSLEIVMTLMKDIQKIVWHEIFLMNFTCFCCFDIPAGIFIKKVKKKKKVQNKNTFLS